ncbi:MAG: NAD-dependent epimerase/dehydratase family protein [Desulfobacterales bacterium]|nr:NAD-dependent epimerase/dehydratase family protein [Desulfobacterales bacterium]
MMDAKNDHADGATKIIVTGGAGFIGSHVVDAYIHSGHDVSVIDNLSTGRKENLNPAARLYQADIRSNELDDIFRNERPHVVNHHAAQISVPESVRNPRFDAEVNVLGFINVLECSIRYKVKKIIFISSGGAIYGEADECPTPETYAPKPLSPYAITKFVSEQYLQFYRHQYGLEYAVLRYANIYGPRQIPKGEAGVVSIFIENLMAGRSSILNAFENEPRGMERDYCYVGDIARANIAALGTDKNGVFNIGTGKATKTADLYDIIYSHFAARHPKLGHPARASERQGDIKRSCLNVEKAMNLLEWKPLTDLRKGIQQTIDWYAAEKK